MALKNLVLTRDERQRIEEQRFKVADPYAAPQQQWGASQFHPGLQDPSRAYGYGQDQYAASYSNYGMPQNAYAPYGGSSASQGMARGGPRPKRGPNPPCNTLFLAKIDALTDEALVQFVRMSCTGYKDHKLTTDRSGQRVAFFEFQSEENATESLQIVNGHQGIQAAYARNPLNQRRY